MEMFTHLNNSWQVKHCHRQLRVGSSKLIRHGTSASWEKTKRKYVKEWFITQEHNYNPLASLLTSKVAGSFKTGEVKGCCYSFSCDFSNAMHGIHESQFDVWTVVESILKIETNDIKEHVQMLFPQFLSI